MKFFILSFATLLASTSVDAQIIYTDVDPDQILTASQAGENFAVDFDGDAVVDYSIFEGIAGYNIASGTAPANSQTAVRATVGTVTTANPLTLNTIIGASNSDWVDPTAAGGGSFGAAFYNAIVQNGATLAGSCNTGSDVYLGIRFFIGSNLHYGWIRINVNADATITIVKDFAYEATPNTQILAGAHPSTAGINENTISAMVYPNPANDLLNIVSTQEIASIVVTSLDGKSVITSNGSSANVATLNSGMYIYIVTTVEGKISTGSFTKN